MVQVIVNNENQLTFFKQQFYGIGHFFNDLVITVWFSYAIIYYQNIMHISSISTGALLFTCQATDAVFAPVLGILFDKTKTRWKHGGRKSWYLFGELQDTIFFEYYMILIYLQYYLHQL